MDSNDKSHNSPISLNNSQVVAAAAEDRFSLLVDSVKDYAIFLLDPAGYILSWNKGAERIKGYTSREAIGKHFSMFYTTNDIIINHPQKELDLALQNGTYEEEGWRVRKNGTTFWANVVLTPLRDQEGNHVGYAKVTRDLTERREAELKLRQSEERLRQMFEGIKDYALITLDPEGNVTSWNEGARRIKGYEASEIIGKSFKNFYSSQDVSMGKCDYELKEAAETGRFEDEGWRIRKDGTKFWANVLITAMRDSKGKLIGFSKVTRDVTDKKRAEDLLKMAYTNLENRVEQRTNELSKANKELEEAVKSRDEFLSIASHELRTPLTPLKLQLQGLNRMLRSGKNLTPEKISALSEACERSVSRLASLIDNLLDVSRMNTGKMILNYEMFDLVELSNEILNGYKDEIARSGSKVSSQFPQKMPVYLDRLRVEQLLTNFLMNALKYGNQKPVNWKIYLEDNLIVIEFIDQGMGIAPKDQERVFNRFERVTHDHNIGGLGLGLYISKQIVEAHGGSISLTSNVGHGATFKISIPLHQ